MRILMLALLTTICFVAALPSAGGAPSAPRGAIVGSVSKIVLVAHKCAQGQRWVAAGYTKHGKYRSGHCAPS